MKMFCFTCKLEYRRGVIHCSECGGRLVYRFRDASQQRFAEDDAEFVVLRTFNNHLNADVARMTLTAAGIESLARTEDSGAGALPQMSLIRGIEILVRSEDFDDADAILRFDASGTL